MSTALDHGSAHLQVDRPGDPIARLAQRGGVGLVCPSQDGHWLGGLYYLHHLVRALEALPANEHWALRDVWWNGPAPADDPFADVRAALGPSASICPPAGLIPRLARRAGRILGGYRGRDAADLFHRAGVRLLFPLPPCENFGIPLAGWVLDFQYRHLSRYYTDEQLRFYENNMRRVGQLACVLMVSSAVVLNDLQTFMPELAPKARIIRPCSVLTNDQLRACPREVARAHDLPERFFLVSNQICTHKNHRTVFEAMRQLAARGVAVHVVCTGKAADFRDPHFFDRLRDDVGRWGLAAQVHFLGALPRSDYLALVRRCLAVLQPSEFEGWGFALSDAKALGKPVFASDLPVHHEHDCPALTLLPTHDSAAWAEALAVAWRDLRPGPDAHAEEEAAAFGQAERLRVGRQISALFTEALTRAPI